MNSVLVEKIACSWFFVAPALAYGLITSRLPAIKHVASLDDAAIATLLLALGVSTFAGLLLAGFAADKFGSKTITAVSIPVFLIAFTLASLSRGFAWIFCFFSLGGFAVGFCDVGMNALGIELERRRNARCLSFLHALSGLGGVVGALSGSLCAALDLSPFVNAVCALGLFICFMPLACRFVMASPPAAAKNLAIGVVPLAAIAFGLANLLCHIAEGSAGSWGSLLLTSVKSASQREAALVFAAFTGSLVCCRLFADNLRSKISDIKIAVGGGLLGCAGMALVLLSPWPWLCLLGYALTGFGLAPIAPLLFSRAGELPGVSPAKASAVISVFSYAGLLLFPPFLGFLAADFGLNNALWTVPCALVLMLPLFAPLGRRASASQS